MSKNINFTDVNPINRMDQTMIKNEILNVIKKKDFILGSPVKKFETHFSKLSKIKYSISCATGTDALLLALKSLDLKKGDEVIVPALTYISTGLAVLLNNNKLIYADVDEDTGLISIQNVLKKITKKTKVIIPVNLYGQKADLKSLRQKTNKRIYIIEDSAQSHFAYSCYNCKKNFYSKCCKKERNDKFADISCYSFYPAKNIGAYGDGGLVSTNNKKLYKKLIALRNLGSFNKHDHQLLGINSRLDTIQAVILNRKLKSILKFNEKRRKISRIYDVNLQKISNLKLTKTKPGSTRHLYVIRSKQRNSLIKYLLRKNIFCQIHYPYSLNKLKPFIKFAKRSSDLKQSQKWSSECMSLPMHPNLKDNDAYRVVHEIKKYFSY